MTSSPESKNKNIKTNDEWSIPTEDGTRRRTIVQGAVWTIPVAAMAVATPAAAASPPTPPPFVCPTTNDASKWRESVTPGSRFASRGTRELSPNGTIHSTQDNRFNSPGQTAGWQVSTSFAGVAGKTYTFTFQVVANYGNYASNGNASVGQNVRFDVNGQSLFVGQTQRTSKTQLPITTNGNNPNWRTYSFSFRPTTTGPISLSFAFEVLALKPDQGRVSGDDITVRLPVTSCS